MECIICKNRTTNKGFVNVPIVREDRIIFIKNIPAEICNNCGEYYIDREVAKEIYGKALVDEKRLLFSQLFTNFTQNGYEIKPNCNLACDYLLKWIPKLNELYELRESLTTKGKKSTFVLSHSILLRG